MLAAVTILSVGTYKAMAYEIDRSIWVLWHIREYHDDGVLAAYPCAVGHES